MVTHLNSYSITVEFSVPASKLTAVKETILVQGKCYTIRKSQVNIIELYQTNYCPKKKTKFAQEFILSSGALSVAKSIDGYLSRLFGLGQKLNFSTSFHIKWRNKYEYMLLINEFNFLRHAIDGAERILCPTPSYGYP